MLLPTAGSVLSAAVTAADTEEFDPNTVTPGVIGFVLTFLVMVAVLLLVLDMVRRIRRVNYRAQVNEQLDAEEREAALGSADAGDRATDASDGEPTEGPGEPTEGPGER